MPQYVQIHRSTSIRSVQSWHVEYSPRRYLWWRRNLPWLEADRMGSTEFECTCGFRFLNSTDNRSYVAWLLADQDYDAFWDLIDAAVEKAGPTPLDKERAVMNLRNSLFASHSRLWQCPECGLIYITDAEGNLHAHAPMGNVPRNLFAGHGLTLKPAHYRTIPHEV